MEILQAKTIVNIPKDSQPVSKHVGHYTYTILHLAEE